MLCQETYVFFLCSLIVTINTSSIFVSFTEKGWESRYKVPELWWNCVWLLHWATTPLLPQSHRGLVRVIAVCSQFGAQRILNEEFYFALLVYVSQGPCFCCISSLHWSQCHSTSTGQGIELHKTLRVLINVLSLRLKTTLKWESHFLHVTHFLFQSSWLIESFLISYWFK